MGMTTNSDIPFAKSLVDYIFRWLGMQFIDGYREQNAPRRTKAAEPAPGNGGAGSAAAHIESKEAGWHGRSSAQSHDAQTDAPSQAASADGGAQAKTDAASILGSRGLTDVPAASIIDGSAGATPQASPTPEPVSAGEARVGGNALDQSNANLMGDAPACDSCGSITVRNGTCYRCLNCGSSMGCS
jgi:ribonucleoside-diphosphate reductase alpha chain